MVCPEPSLGKWSTCRNMMLVFFVKGLEVWFNEMQLLAIFRWEHKAHTVTARSVDGAMIVLNQQ